MIFIISSRYENETKLKILIIQQVMVNKISVSGCLNNEATGDKKKLSTSCPQTLICSASGFLFWYEMNFCHRNMYSSATNTSPIISWREIITDSNWLAALIPFQPFYLKIKRLLMFLRHNVSNKTRLHERRHQNKAAFVLYDRVNW